MTKERKSLGRLLMVFLMAIMFMCVSWAFAEESHAAASITPKNGGVFTYGTDISVKANGTYDATQWIALVDKGGTPTTSDTEYYWWSRTNTDTYQTVYGTCMDKKYEKTETVLTSDYWIPPGQYDLVLMSEGYAVLDRETITVKSLSAPTSVKCGDSLTVSFNHASEVPSSQYDNWWIGLYEENKDPSKDTTSICWYYVTSGDEIDMMTIKNWAPDQAPGMSRYKAGNRYKLVLVGTTTSDSKYILETVYVDLEHNWGNYTTTTPATCVSNGTKTRTCTCGATDSETIQATGVHNYTGTKTVTAGNCIDKSVTTTKCENCSSTKTEYGSIDSSKHKSPVTDPAVAATCTSTGLTAGSHCSACNKTIVAQTATSMLQHDYTGQSSTVTQQADCVTPQKTKTKCKNCSNYKEETGSTDSSVHKSGALVDIAAVAPTCEANGLTAGQRCSACDVITLQPQTDPALGHMYDDGVPTKPATCESAGEMTYTCQRGCTKTEVIPRLEEHSNLNEGEITKDATCKEEGVLTRTCSLCNRTVEETIPRLDKHSDLDEGQITKNATCNETGIMTYTCGFCNRTVKEVIPKSTEHQHWDNGIETVAPTCESAGVKTYTCGLCNTTRTEGIPSREHQWNNGVVTTDPTCHKLGEKTFTCEYGCKRTEEVAKLTHNWVDADCDTPKECSLCHDTEGNALGHIWGDGPTCENAKRCEREGCLATKSALGHDMTEATCTKEAACKRAGCTYTEDALGHQKSENAATCTTPQVCTREGCDHVFQSALGHAWIEADCTTAKTCERCRIPEGSPLGHEAGEPATCTTPQLCTRCPETLDNATGHKPPENAAPTCGRGVNCANCSVQLSPATGRHAWKNATCSDPKTCSVCGATTGSALGHKWNDATCTTAKTCATCGTKEGNPLGHTASGEASCTEAKTCSRCKIMLEAAKGHRAGDAATCTTDQSCTVCGITLSPAKGHHEVIIQGKTSTCTEEGVTDGKRCDQCQEILVAQEGLPKQLHSIDKTEITPATFKSAGKVVKTCECGEVLYTEDVARIKSVELSIKKAAYKGKKIIPTLTITDRSGKTLVRNKDYTVKVPTGRKNVGTYTYVVTFKDKYAGTKEVSFEIVPKKAIIKKPKAGKKSITVKWKKVTKQATGYQVMYSTSKKFKKGKTTKTKLVTSYKKSSLKISKLKAKKTYYVKVRTYKTVKVNGKKVKVYSGWSNIMKVKTR